MKIIYLSIVTLLMFSILNNCIAQISFLDKT
ncbi:MAG: hypothetical protein ACI86M_004054, partial [Saprospiraceae bacterium]